MQLIVVTVVEAGDGGGATCDSRVDRCTVAVVKRRQLLIGRGFVCGRGVVQQLVLVRAHVRAEKQNT